MSPARHLRRRRFITATVDVQSGQIIDVFNGRDASDLRKWLGEQPVWWRDGIEVVSMDPHEGYRSAIKASAELIGDVMIVVDPFHIVRLANQAVIKCRQRVQQATLHHRGWTNDPLYDIRKLLLMGAERLDDKAWTKIHEGLRYGDPTTWSNQRGGRESSCAMCTSSRTLMRRLWRSTKPLDGAPILKPLASSWRCPRPSPAGEPRS